MKRLRFCGNCGEYTMMEEHCGAPPESAYPPRFSPQDKWAEYRKKARESQ